MLHYLRALACVLFLCFLIFLGYVQHVQNRIDRFLRDKAPTRYASGCRYAGCGLPLNETQVRFLYEMAEQGDAEAQLLYAECCRKGEGVPQDDAQAAVWYRKAAEQGLAVAQFNLGLCFADGKGVPQDAAQAAVWFRKAAGQGHANAREALVLYGMAIRNE